MTEEQRQLAAENHDLIYSFLRTYGYDVEEYYDLAAIGLCKAAMTYSNDISRFSTYAYRCMQNTVYKEIRIKTYARTIPDRLIYSYNTTVAVGDGETYEVLDYLPCDVDLEEDILTNVHMEHCLNRGGLTDQDRLVFDLLMAGYSSSEIGRVIGCGKERVKYIKGKLVRKLRQVW